MAFLAGVDEAGYGPFLGPLVFGCALVHVPDADADLWPLLARSAARRPGRRDARLWLDDSKRVHAGPHGRARLERSVAAFRELTAPGRHALDAWIGEAPAGDPRRLHDAPWFRTLSGPLCPTIAPDRARLDAATLRRDLDAAGASVTAFAARAVTAGEWNALLARTGGKGDAHFAVCMEVVRWLLARTGDAPLRIELDRHGARRRYAEPLRRALAPEAVEVHGEASAGSSYTLHFPHRRVQLRFSEGADGRHAPVALASLAAKQTRERMMDLLNAWFAERAPEVAHTRGYGVDGKRWLAEIEPRLDALAVAPALLRRRR